MRLEYLTTRAAIASATHIRIRSFKKKTKGSNPKSPRSFSIFRHPTYTKMERAVEVVQPSLGENRPRTRTISTEVLEMESVNSNLFQACFAQIKAPFISVDTSIEDEEQAISILTSRIQDYITRRQDEDSREINPIDPLILSETKFEISLEQIKRIYNSNKKDIDNSFNHWCEWIKWRNQMGIHNMKDEDFTDISKLGIASWRGKNREGLPCLVLTGRLMLPQIQRQGLASTSRLLYKKYVCYIVEKGIVNVLNQNNCEKCCIIYDRRGMGFEHIDIGLGEMIKPIIKEISKYYRDRINVIYVLHLNILWRILYQIVMLPLLFLVGSSDKIITLQTRNELLEYFENGDLLIIDNDSVDRGNGNAEVEIDVSKYDQYEY
jgi:hypothetical protein